MLRAEITRELLKKPEPPKDLPGDARNLLNLAESRGIFNVKSRIGFFVAGALVALLREEHKKTNVCWCWPFC